MIGIISSEYGKQSLNLAEKEKANRFIVELAALLHDLIDDKIVSNKNEAIKEDALMA